MKAKTGTIFWLAVILGSDLSPVDKLLLISLADHVDAVDECFVGLETMARHAGCGYSTARRRVKALEEGGYLSRERRRRDDGNLSVYTYRIHRSMFGEPPLDSDAPPLDLSGDHRSQLRAVTTAHPGERTEVPRTEVPRNEQSVASGSTGVSDGGNDAQEGDRPGGLMFEAFWDAYPRRVGRVDAIRELNRALTKTGGDAANILEGARRFARTMQGTEPRYLPAPAKWLAGERWDERPPPEPMTELEWMAAGRPALAGRPDA